MKFHLKLMPIALLHALVMSSLAYSQASVGVGSFDFNRGGSLSLGASVGDRPTFLVNESGAHGNQLLARDIQVLDLYRESGWYGRFMPKDSSPVQMPGPGVNGPVGIPMINGGTPVVSVTTPNKCPYTMPSPGVHGPVAPDPCKDKKAGGSPRKQLTFRDVVMESGPMDPCMAFGNYSKECVFKADPAALSISDKALEALRRK